MGKKNKDSLGRALIKQRFAKNKHRKHVDDNTMLHTTEINDGYEWGRLNLKSVTAESSVQEFLSTAELAQKEFIAEKLNVKFVKSAPDAVETITSQPDFSEPLTVPRRPAWEFGITTEEQLDRERQSYLLWRKHLTELQERLGAQLTPYERNIELWRQLWRTLERSDVVLILLDARNPLLFRCADLEKYAMEHKCKCILLLNKADLTSEYQRKCWTNYFNKEHTSVIFFSAVINKEKDIIEESDEQLKKESEEDKDSNVESESSDLEDNNDGSVQDQPVKDEENSDSLKKQLHDLDEAMSVTDLKLNKIQETLDKVLLDFKLSNPIEIDEEIGSVGATTKNNIVTEDIELQNTDKEMNNPYEIYDRIKLIEVLKKIKVENKKNPPRLSVGLIGYPNVGKSSTINNLMRTKKVSVSSMPGHTRHIQTLVLDDDIMLLDCPGLVLPSYAVTPDLLLTAVLPLDEMRAYDAAMTRLCQLVNRQTFIKQYGLLLPDTENKNAVDYRQILTAHAYNRGFMSQAGQPDQSRSARLLLKDAASGRLQWEQLPPGFEPVTPVEIEIKKDKREPTPREKRMVEGWINKSQDVDKVFFSMNNAQAHVKGKPVMGLSGVQPAEGTSEQIVGKPWKKEKKHANKNKREKLRRVYAHLDRN